MRFLAEGCRLAGETLHILNLDVQKAYDSVSPILLEVALRRLSVPNGYIRLVLATMEDGRRRVETAYGLSPSFIPRSGLEQGEI